MNICVSFLFWSPSFISFQSLSRRWLSLGRYPLKAKFWPFIPDAIMARRIELGPTCGITRQPALCAIRTAAAPGSATPGAPASESNAMSASSLNHCKRSTRSSGRVCSFRRKLGLTLGFSSGKASFSKRLALRSLSTMSRLQSPKADRVRAEITS